MFLRYAICTSSSWCGY